MSSEARALLEEEQQMRQQELAEMVGTSNRLQWINGSCLNLVAVCFCLEGDMFWEYVIVS